MGQNFYFLDVDYCSGFLLGFTVRDYGRDSSDFHCRILHLYPVVCGSICIGRNDGILYGGAVIPRLPVKKGIAIVLLCEFYRMITLGNGSGIAEIHYLHKNGMETGSATVMTMIQYMVKRMAVMLLGTLGFFVLCRTGRGRAICHKYAAFMGTGCVITIGVIVFFMGLTLSSKIAAWTGKLLDWLCRRFPSWEKHFLEWKTQAVLLNHSGKNIVEQKYRLLGAILLQTGKMLLFYAIPVCLLYGKSSLAFAENIFLMAVVYMLAGVIPAPSGVGALEFVFLLFFSGFTESGAALPAILLFRFVTWILPFGVGGEYCFGREYEKNETGFDAVRIFADCSIYMI